MGLGKTIQVLALLLLAAASGRSAADRRTCSWCRRRCSATGRPRSSASRRAARRSSRTPRRCRRTSSADAARAADSAPPTSCSPPTAPLGARRGCGERAWGARRARRGAGDQEPGRQADARRQGLQGATPASRSPARRSRTASATCGRSSTSSPRAARLGARVHGVRRSASTKRPERRLRAAAPARPPVHPAAAQDRPRDHRRPARQDRGERVLRASPDAGRALRAGRRASCERELDGRRRASQRRGRRPRLPHALQADLQPPLAVARRRRVDAPRTAASSRACASSCEPSPRGRRRCSSSPSSAR